MVGIRPVKSDDLDALYAISLATGFEGGDASHLYNDPRLMGHIYSAPYAILEPHLGIVAEDSTGVVGFAVGAADTRKWEDRLEREWWPHLRLRYANPSGAARESWSPDQRRASMIHHPSRAPDELVGKYPSHLHMNLLPRVQGRGLGSAMFDNWRSIAARHGSNGVHVGVNRSNKRGISFWGKIGFAEQSIKGVAGGRTVWMGLS